MTSNVTGATDVPGGEAGITHDASLPAYGAPPGDRVGAAQALPTTSWLDSISLAEAGLLLDVAVILDLAAIYVQVIGAVFAIAVPTPFAILMLRRGPRVSLLAAAVASFLVTILAGLHFGWHMGLQALLGMLLGWAMQRRLRSLTVVGLGTVLIAGVSVLATFGLIVFEGVPISDVVMALRNVLGSGAWLLAGALELVGGGSYWLAARPTLAAVGLLALSLWPLLLFAYTIALTGPLIVLQYTAASSTARVLGHEVRRFPPRWLLVMMPMVVAFVAWPMALPLAVFALAGLVRAAVHRLRRPGVTIAPNRFTTHGEGTRDMPAGDVPTEDVRASDGTAEKSSKGAPRA
jgi:hypothetical protein